MRNKYLYITLFTLLGLNAEAQAQLIAKAPRLVVNITIDQLRSDFLETYAPLYGPDGLNRLLKEGMVFTNGTYNFTPVDRASAIAATQTGTSPYYNGITAYEWLDRETLRPQICVADNKTGHSPEQLGTSTIGDELKVATNGAAKVFSFAPTADAAILSAGHAADGAIWMENGRWDTSNYYQPANKWLTGYIKLYEPRGDVNKSITEAVLKCVGQAGIGIDEKTDLINLTYEVDRQMESYVALDRTISRLIKGIENHVTRDRVLFVVTGTGNHDQQDDDNNILYRIPTGNFYINRTANLLNMYLGAVYGQGQYVEQCYKNQIFFNQEVIRKRNLNLGEMMTRSQEFLLQISGVRNVYTANQLATSDSYLLEKIRNGFNIKKCGDLIIEVTPGWRLISEDSTDKPISRTANIPVPIIFYGYNTHTERILNPVTTDRVAPTICRAIRIRAPNACSALPLF